ncbi:phytanoyl-CoA dioxygenase family protein [Planctobacterium marinum]|uniref:Phytanoyl-CoA dioxygenase n=1 Tax=Planctobacterium marinum TaxID=1631968 RepID=A0AA48HXM9_9ALTE|nr:hypothetical protein MACH26_32890 [Planctobacterium marinum]
MKAISLSELNREALLRELNTDNGYLVANISMPDYQHILTLITEQYLHVLQMVCPHKVKQFHAEPINQYHKIYQPEDFDHASTWSKNARLLGPSAVKSMLSGAIGTQLNRLFGDYLLADEENMGWPGIYWRLVRPGNTDIGSVHADKWFWDLGHGDMPTGYTRVKLWMSVCTVLGSSGLQVVPHSQHSDDWKYHGEWRNGMQKPVLDEDLQSLNLVSVETQPGDCIIFHDKLLHGGMINSSDETRVSLEFTILTPIQEFVTLGLKQ